MINNDSQYKKRNIFDQRKKAINSPNLDLLPDSETSNQKNPKKISNIQGKLFLGSWKSSKKGNEESGIIKIEENIIHPIEHKKGEKILSKTKQDEIKIQDLQYDLNNSKNDQDEKSLSRFEEESLILGKVEESDNTGLMTEKLREFYQTDGYRTNVIHNLNLKKSENSKKSKIIPKKNSSNSCQKRGYLSLITYMDKMQEKESKKGEEVPREVKRENFLELKKNILKKRNIDTKEVEQELEEVKRRKKVNLKKLKIRQKKEQIKRFSSSRPENTRKRSGLRSLHSERNPAYKAAKEKPRNFFILKKKKKKKNFNLTHERKSTLESHELKQKASLPSAFQITGVKKQKNFLKKKSREEGFQIREQRASNRRKQQIRKMEGRSKNENSKKGKNFGVKIQRKNFIFPNKPEIQRKNSSSLKVATAQAIIKAKKLKSLRASIDINYKAPKPKYTNFFVKKKKENTIITSSLTQNAYVAYRYSTRYNSNRKANSVRGKRVESSKGFGVGFGFGKTLRRFKLEL